MIIFYVNFLIFGDYTNSGGTMDVIYTSQTIWMFILYLLGEFVTNFFQIITHNETETPKTLFEKDFRRRIPEILVNLSIFIHFVLLKLFDC